ncbi:hypothetical protein [Cyclobacterium plantarum]|uniref:Uncharacterized protein n=1 Tax=Cyclobacterium plantarum TaxID=2716263 RepID=A0ABX0HDJ7_9BACT|nr:hypothetical protein [Cyclobacterium plantarum]NHE59961.1 hypothetical protein [Cyclobacterium plantarum]
MFSFRLEIVFLVVFIFCFLFSLGRFNLIDYILNIKVKSKEYKKTPIKNLIIYGSILLLLLFSSSIEFLLSPTDGFDQYRNRIGNVFATEYFPKERISDFMAIKVPIVTIEKTNNIVTISDFSSIFLNRSLKQKSIKVLVNNKIHNSVKLREELCNKLIAFSKFNDIIFNNKIYQTRIILIYIELTSMLTNKIIEQGTFSITKKQVY